MASKTEALRIGTQVRRHKVISIKQLAAAFARWSMRGQLGGSGTSELARHTGARC